MNTYDKIPREMRETAQWVCWQLRPNESKPGEFRKVPINAATGGDAMSNNPATWGSFELAVEKSAQYDGIGFVLDNGFFGVDLDDCPEAIESYQHGDDDNIVGEFVHSLKSYAEYSPSGNGIHIICKGALPKGRRRKGSVEMYEKGRYFTVTGRACSPYTALADGTEPIKRLHAKYLGGGEAPTTGIALTPIIPLNLSDAQIIKMAEESKQGALFKSLWSGDYSSYFRSQSEADLALCNILAFWTGKDAELMNKLFEQSGLMRPKWKRKQANSTYGEITIRKAIRDCTNVYQPKARYSIHIGTEAHQDLPYKFYTFDDTGNANRFIDRFGQSVLYNYTAKAWMYYDGRRWVQDDDGQSKRMADEIVEEVRHGLKAYLENLDQDMDKEDAEKLYLRHVKAMRSSRGKENMIKEAQHLRQAKTIDFDLHPYKLCVLNGTLNLVDGNLLPHNRDDMISKLAVCEYTDKCDTPRWTAFLEEIFAGDKDLIRFVQKAVGYSLTGSTEEHCAFFCYGTGRNGKSTFLDIVSELMGDYAVNIQPETIMVRQASSGPTSDIARLKGARLVTTVEPSEGARLNEGLLKQLTGGDRVTAAKKYEDEFEFSPEFKLWMGTNHKPIIRGTDVGIWSRIRLIPFNVQIPDERIDRKLKFKLREEIPGILAWAVDGCLMWRREGLKSPDSVNAASKEYRSEMDVLASFLEACCIDGGEIEAGDLFRAYLDWAKESNEYEMSSTKFGREIGKRYDKRISMGKKIYIGISVPKTVGIKVSY